MYARYACAVYGVQKYEDEPRPEDRTDDRPKKRACGSCGCSSDPLTEASIRQEVAKVAGIAEKDILYMSPSNQVLAHLPYMIALDRYAALDDTCLMPFIHHSLSVRSWLGMSEDALFIQRPAWEKCKKAYNTGFYMLVWAKASHCARVSVLVCLA